MWLPEENANLEKMGELRMRRTSGAAAMTKGLPSLAFAAKESSMGTSTVGIVVETACAGSWPRSV